ncbi:unnamed protein product [Heligmosomoides polygyrus]|uniref:VID27 domain-containing protein n=1 Tax=Heligmosomoides polygyrus TaxID=6339 RepID=A0A183FSB2_HELPZ|nr:unnamed protein product [Heligmosomoides polygyrus]
MFAAILREGAATFAEIETDEDLDAADTTDNDSDWDYSDDAVQARDSGRPAQHLRLHDAKARFNFLGQHSAPYIATGRTKALYIFDFKRSDIFLSQTTPVNERHLEQAAFIREFTSIISLPSDVTVEPGFLKTAVRGSSMPLTLMELDSVTKMS